MDSRESSKANHTSIEGNAITHKKNGANGKKKILFFVLVQKNG